MKAITGTLAVVRSNIVEPVKSVRSKRGPQTRTGHVRQRGGIFGVAERTIDQADLGGMAGHSVVASRAAMSAMASTCM